MVMTGPTPEVAGLGNGFGNAVGIVKGGRPSVGAAVDGLTLGTADGAPLALGDAGPCGWGTMATRVGVGPTGSGPSAGSIDTSGAGDVGLDGTGSVVVWPTSVRGRGWAGAEP
jgi:hypothetical protein